MIEINNWTEFQHYKDRTPPWIKLYRRLLDDREYRQLSDTAARLLFDLWLLAAESKDGIILLDVEDIAWRLRDASKTIADYEKSLKEIEKQGFISLDSTMLADCKQDAIPETEERQRQRRGENNNKTENLDFSGWPKMPDEQILKDWEAMRKRLKANVSQTVINNFGKELHKAVNSGFTVDECLSECVTRNWRGFKAEWLQNIDGKSNGQTTGQSTSRAKRVADELDRIAREDIEQNGLPEILG